MNGAFTFYRALDPVRGSWDGYGYFPAGDNDFLAFVSDAPSGASIQTPELVKAYWSEYCKAGAGELDPGLRKIELADAVNKLQVHLLQRSRQDGATYQTTLSVVRKIGDSLFYCSIGDSTIQLLRNGQLYRLTESDVWDGGLIVKNQTAVGQRKKTEVLDFIGTGGRFVSPAQVKRLDLQPNDRIFLNTDGLEDVLPPTTLLALASKTPEQMRSELESICAQQKIKDDVTLLSAVVNVAPAINLEQEMLLLKNQMETIRKEQAQFREDFTRITLPSGRLERIEKSVNQISQQLANINKKVDGMKAQRGTQIIASNAQREWAHKPLWLLGAVAAAALVIATALFLYARKPAAHEQNQKPNSVRYQQKPPVSRNPAGIVPPAIPEEQEQNCDYTVQKGDSLQKIASENKLTMEELLRFNPGLKPTIQIGQKIRLCGAEN